MRDLARFIGPKTMLMLALAIIAGIGGSGAELLLAYSLEAFLRPVMGFSAPIAHSFFAYLPKLEGQTMVIGMLTFAVLLRGLVIWATNYSNSAAHEHFKFAQRRRILDAAFKHRELGTKDSTVMFNENASNAAFAIGTFESLCISVVSVVSLLVILFSMSPRTTALVLALMLPLALPTRLLNRRIHAMSEQCAKLWPRLSTRMMRGLKNLLFLRIYGLVDSECEKTKDELGQHFATNLKSRSYGGLTPAYTQAAAIGIVCFTTLIAHSLDHKSGGELVPYFYLLYRFFGHLTTTSYNVVQFSMNRPYLAQLFHWWRNSETRLDELSSTPSNDNRSESASHGLAQVAAPSWRIQDLHFTHPGSTEPVFEDFSASIEAGLLTALVGRSGSGKSTLINLLLGVEASHEGRIEMKIGDLVGAPAELKDHVLAHVGYVGAESFLIDATIRENLRYGLSHEPSASELAEALELAHCDFVAVSGLDRPITELGEGLSMGQKQRLCLARALLRRPSLLVLDEATASLDMASEAKIVESLIALRGRITIVAATHHKAFFERADRVIQLHQRPTRRRAA